MADIIVSDLVTNLSQLLSNTEVKFLEEDKEGVRSLCNEFRYIKLLINSYEGKPIKDNIMFPVDKIEEVASEAEKIYEGYVENVAKQKKRSNLVKLLLGSNQARMFHDFTEKITKLQTKIRDIYEYHIQQKGVSEDAYQFQKHRPKGVTLVNQLQIQQTGVDEAERSQRYALLQKQSPKGLVGFVEEEETLVNQRHIQQQTGVDEAERSQSHASLQKQRKEVEEDDVVGLVEEEETLMNQQQIQQTSVDEAEGSNSHALLQKQTPKEVKEDDVVGFEEEEDDVVGLVEEKETLVNQQQIQQTSVDEAEGSQEVEEDDVVGFEEEEETLRNQKLKGTEELDVISISASGKTTLARTEDYEDHFASVNVSQVFKPEDDVVGFLEEAKILVNKLVEGTEELDVISIVGIGGSGKTTIARKVYGNPFVKERFRCCTWVSVSVNFDLKELLLAIINQVMTTRTTDDDNISEKKAEQLKQELKKQLSNHRYLVVLDDIWSRELWDELNEVFPDDKNGSRVVLTTRYRELPYHASRNPPLCLRFMNEVESWELFTNKVFRGQPCPTDLEPLGREIVASCGGLPLAIVLLGGLLGFREKNELNWKDMVVGFNSCTTQETYSLEYILDSSYKNLPSYLQPCFLYMGLFPEQYKIPARQLIQLWISEGFIQKDDDNMPRKEDVAEDYLNELIARSLIQVVEWRSDSGAKTCCCHDIIHDLCVRLCTEENFSEFEDGIGIRIPSSKIQTKPRRLSIFHCSLQDYIRNAEPSNIRQVQTLLSFDQHNEHIFSEEHWTILFKHFKLLRVLDLGDGKVRRIPKEAVKLIQLKYLRVKTADIAAIPSAIFDLRQLQTLDLRRSRIKVLPAGIWRMRQLRHLYLDGPSRLPQKTGKNCLVNLQTLCYISQDPDWRVKIAEKAPNLRKLGLYGYRCHSLDEEKSTFNLPYLESLKFYNECTFEEAIKLPQSITKISIKTAYLQPKTMEVLQNLSNLQILKLDGVTFEDNELVFKRGWFPQLQLLKIEDSSIVSWKLEQGAVPKLKRVVISKCPGLDMIPNELWDITSLQKLELLWLPGRITKMIGDFKKSDQLEIVIHPEVNSELV